MYKPQKFKVKNILKRWDSNQDVEVKVHGTHPHEDIKNTFTGGIILTEN